MTRSKGVGDLSQLQQVAENKPSPPLKPLGLNNHHIINGGLKT
jgi:hypothetical protein